MDLILNTPIGKDLPRELQDKIGDYYKQAPNINMRYFYNLMLSEIQDGALINITKYVLYIQAPHDKDEDTGNGCRYENVYINIEFEQWDMSEVLSNADYFNDINPNDIDELSQYFSLCDPASIRLQHPCPYFEDFINASEYMISPSQMDMALDDLNDILLFNLANMVEKEDDMKKLVVDLKHILKKEYGDEYMYLYEDIHNLESTISTYKKDDKQFKKQYDLILVIFQQLMKARFILRKYYTFERNRIVYYYESNENIHISHRHIIYVENTKLLYNMYIDVTFVDKVEEYNELTKSSYIFNRSPYESLDSTTLQIVINKDLYVVDAIQLLDAVLGLTDIVIRKIKSSTGRKILQEVISYFSANRGDIKDVLKLNTKATRQYIKSFREFIEARLSKPLPYEEKMAIMLYANLYIAIILAYK